MVILLLVLLLLLPLAPPVGAVGCCCGGGTINFMELDGDPFGSFSTIKVPNTSLTNNGDGTATFAPSGSGNVSSTGTPTNGQACRWTNATTIEGVTPTGTGTPVNNTSPTLTTPFLSGVNTQTGATYTVVAADNQRLVTFNNAAAVAVTLPVASTAGFTNGAVFHFRNLGAGVVTITPTTSQIDGVGTLLLRTDQSAIVFSNGTNYFAERMTNSPLTTAGDTLYGGVSGTPVRLAGAAGLYRSNGTTPSWAELSGDATTSGSNAVTLATVNANVGSFTNATITVNAKGLITAAATGTGGAGTPVQLSAATGTVSALACGNVELYYRHDMTGAIVIPAFTGTCTNGQTVRFRLKPNTGGALGLTFNTGASKAFSQNGLALPTTTLTSTEYVDYAFVYNATSDRFAYVGGTKATAPLSVADGGTGAVTLTGMIKGNGVSAMTAGVDGTDYISPTGTATLTGKTYDAEGTGNVLTTVTKIWLPAASCQNVTAQLLWDTRTTQIPVAACATSHGVADFATDSGTLSMHTTLLLPDDWTGVIGGKVLWFSAATANNVAWQVETLCIADAEVDSITFANTTEIVDTAKGTTNQLNATALTTLTTTGCAAGELMHIQIRRDPADAQDTFAAATTARFYGLELTARRAQ